MAHHNAPVGIAKRCKMPTRCVVGVSESFFHEDVVTGGTRLVVWLRLRLRLRLRCRHRLWLRGGNGPLARGQGGHRQGASGRGWHRHGRRTQCGESTSSQRPFFMYAEHNFGQAVQMALMYVVWVTRSIRTRSEGDDDPFIPIGGSLRV